MATTPQSPDQAIAAIGPVTVTHVVLMVALAALAVAVIWWGAVLRRRRKAAEKQVAANFEVAEEHGATSDSAATLLDGETAPVSADVPQPGETGLETGLETAPETGRETGIADDLTQIKGLGPKVAAMLGEHGITRVAHLASLNVGAAAALEAQLGTFQGRMTRDRWIEQAKLLSTGDRAGYEATFGKLGG